MSTAISPLAPKAYPAMPAIAGVAFATAEAGIKYKNRTDVLLAVFDKGTAGRRRLHPLEMPLGAGRLVRRCTRRRQGAGAPRQFRQCQCLHRQEGPRDRAAFRRDGGEGARLPGEAGLPRLDRRDRRAARPGEIRAASSARWRRGVAADRWTDAAQGDHDHRHLSQARDAHRAVRRRDRDHQRHRQGRRA